jgi:hypothetical protein
MKINSSKANIILKAFALTKVPMILFTGVSIVEISEHRTVIKIPLNWRTKNHLKSMYFGALAVGADVASGLYASLLIRDSKKKIHLSFKDFKANFLKRPTDDVYFIVNNHTEIKQLIEDVINHPNERKNLSIPVIATTNIHDTQDSTVADFSLTLSLKLK